MNDQDKITWLTAENANLHKALAERKAKIAELMGEAARAEMAAGPVASVAQESTEALLVFTEYFVKNYPGPDTIIADPKWHAPRIFRAAKRALKSATLASVPQMAVPQGYKAMPIKLTPKMTDVLEFGRKQPSHNTWLNLLAAAPEVASGVAPLPELTGPSVFLQAAKDFAQAHIDSDEIDSKVDRNMDAITDGEMIASHAVYNSTKAKLLKAYRALAASPSPAPAQPTGPLYEEQPDGAITEVDQSDLFGAAPAQPTEPSLKDSLAEALHYPGCWDTAAYPALSDALSAVYDHFKCSECAAPGASIRDKQ
jgi:hypothetical protein